MDGMSSSQGSMSPGSAGLMSSMEAVLAKNGGMHPIGTGEHVPLDSHSSSGSPVRNGHGFQDAHSDDSQDDESSMDDSLLNHSLSNKSFSHDPEMPKLAAS